MNIADLPDRLFDRLPPFDYGAQRVVASYTGCHPSKFRIFGQWQHAWIGEYRNIHPELVIGGNGKSRLKKAKSRFFVARSDHVEYLRDQGYRHVYAIGAPIIYLPDKSFRRIQNSLLIVPMHTLPTTREDWTGEGRRYVKFLKQYVHQFSSVAACVHPSCMEKNFWVKELRDLGVDIVSGADPRDKNSLERMRALFSQYEFVTTNGHGSQVAYASYFGAKVSVCGPKPKWDSSKRTDVFFQNAPELLAEFKKWRTTDFLDNFYPQFNTMPYQAKTNVDWAKYELGEIHRMEPSQLRKTLDFSFHRVARFQAYNRSIHFFTVLRSLMSQAKRFR